MADLISRAAAIDAIAIEFDECGIEYGPNEVVHRVTCELKNLPAVDAVPVVHGRWVYKERHRKSYRTYTGFDAAGEEHTITVCLESAGKEPYCSNCGAQAAESFMDYCPNCGAKIDGDGDG